MSAALPFFGEFMDKAKSLGESGNDPASLRFPRRRQGKQKITRISRIPPRQRRKQGVTESLQKASHSMLRMGRAYSGKTHARTCSAILTFGGETIEKTGFAKKDAGSIGNTPRLESHYVYHI